MWSSVAWSREFPSPLVSPHAYDWFDGEAQMLGFGRNETISVEANCMLRRTCSTQISYLVSMLHSVVDDATPSLSYQNVEMISGTFHLIYFSLVYRFAIQY